MNGFEDIEKKIKNIGRKTTPDTDQRILDDAFASLEQVPRTHPAPAASILILRAVAAVIIILVILGLVFIFSRPVQPPKKIAKPSVITETTPEPPKELSVSEPNTEHGSREETVKELQKELEHMVVLAQAGDVNGLLVVLDEGSVPAKMLAANYLAQIGDLRAAKILEALAVELTPDDPNSVFAIAAKTIKTELKESSAQPEPAVDIPSEAETEPVKRSISGWLVDTNGIEITGTIQIGKDKVLTDQQGGFTIAEPDYKSFFSTFGRVLSSDGNLGSLFVWQHSADMNEVEIVLQAFAGIKGRVTNSNVEPVNDFKLTLSPYVTDQTLYNGDLGEMPWRETMNPDGTFEIESIPVGLPLGLSITKPGFKTDVSLDLIAGQTLDLNDVVLEPLPGFHDGIEWECSLAGYVLNENNEPLADASVSAIIGEERYQTTSDSRGWYEFKNLPNDVVTQIVPYFDGYGNNLFGYDRTDCNSRLDIQMFPQAYDWYGQPAPSLVVRNWLNCEPFDLESLTGKVVLLCMGLDCKSNDCLREIEQFHEYFSDQNDLVIIAVHEYIEPNSPKEDELLNLIESLEFDFPIAIDEYMDAAEEMVLPEYRRLEGDRISIRKRGLSSSGAAHSVYQVRQRPAYFLIDKAGILRVSIAAENLYEWIDRLLAE